MRPESRRPDAVFFRLVGQRSATRVVALGTIRVLTLLLLIRVLAILRRVVALLLP